MSLKKFPTCRQTCENKMNRVWAALHVKPSCTFDHPGKESFWDLHLNVGGVECPPASLRVRYDVNPGSLSVSFDRPHMAAIQIFLTQVRINRTFPTWPLHKHFNLIITWLKLNGERLIRVKDTTFSFLVSVILKWLILCSFKYQNEPWQITLT